jgi:hypothetical protein
MRQSVHLGLIGLAVVYLAFFSSPVPKVVKDILYTGLGRFVALGGIVYLTMYQSVPLALLAVVFYVKAVHSTYHEGFTADSDKCKDMSKLSMDEKKECAKWEATKDMAKTVKEEDPSRTSSKGGVPSHKGSSDGAVPSGAEKTEHYENFASF